MEFLIIFALGIIAWFAWQLYRAKQFTRFRKYLVDNVQPQVLEHIEQHLIESRDNCFPNNDCHISASKIYWTACHARILQYALIHEILSETQLRDNNQYRFCQHLFHIEASKMH